MEAEVVAVLQRNARLEGHNAQVDVVEAEERQVDTGGVQLEQRLAGEQEGTGGHIRRPAIEGILLERNVPLAELVPQRRRLEHMAREQQLRLVATTSAAQELEHILGRHIVVVIDEEVEVAAIELLAGPAHPQHGFQCVVEVGVREVRLQDVAMLAGLPGHVLLALLAVAQQEDPAQVDIREAALVAPRPPDGLTPLGVGHGALDEQGNAGRLIRLDFGGERGHPQVGEPLQARSRGGVTVQQGVPEVPLEVQLVQVDQQAAVVHQQDEGQDQETSQQQFAVFAQHLHCEVNQNKIKNDSCGHTGVWKNTRRCGLLHWKKPWVM